MYCKNCEIELIIIIEHVKLIEYELLYWKRDTIFKKLLYPSVNKNWIVKVPFLSGIFKKNIILSI